MFVQTLIKGISYEIAAKEQNVGGRNVTPVRCPFYTLILFFKFTSISVLLKVN